MKVVLDENVSNGLAEPLRRDGFEVLAVGPDLASGSSDETVFAFVSRERAVLVTRDHHFTNPVRFDPAQTLGIVYIRQGNLSSAQEISLVLGFFKKYPAPDFIGKLVTLYLDSVRMR